MGANNEGLSERNSLITSHAGLHRLLVCFGDSDCGGGGMNMFLSNLSRVCAAGFAVAFLVTTNFDESTEYLITAAFLMAFAFHDLGRAILDEIKGDNHD